MTLRSPQHARAAGFTMIELLITVAVIAILAAVAVPNYIDYVIRSKLVEAKSNLSDMRTRLEQHFLDNRAYPNACIAYAAGPAGAGNVYLPASSKYFTYTCALAAATYTVTATGISTAGTGGFVFTIDESNNRRTTGVPTGWTTSNACWVTRKNGDC